MDCKTYNRYKHDFRNGIDFKMVPIDTLQGKRSIIIKIKSL